MTLIEFLRLSPGEKENGVWLSGIEGEGEYIQYWSNGHIYKLAHYKDGELHGEYKDWHGNGQIWEHSYYKKRKYHGECKEWHSNGELYMHSLYRNGIEIKDYLK